MQAAGGKRKQLEPRERERGVAVGSRIRLAKKQGASRWSGEAEQRQRPNGARWLWMDQMADPAWWMSLLHGGRSRAGLLNQSGPLVKKNECHEESCLLE